MTGCITFRQLSPNPATFQVRVFLYAGFLQLLQFDVVLSDFLKQHQLNGQCLFFIDLMTLESRSQGVFKGFAAMGMYSMLVLAQLEI